MDEVIDKAFEKAKETVTKCSTEYGLFASGGKSGYKGVWSRDSFITFLGASLIKGKERELYKETFKKSLVILGNKQSKKGQVPNAVYNFDKKNPTVDYLSIDSSLWFVIGHYIYKKRYNDNSLFKKYDGNIKRALSWLAYQDVGETMMLGQLPTTDWQDAFPHKYGYTINTQALYYYVLSLVSKKEARKLKSSVNEIDDIKLWNGKYYWPYRWKNHGKYKERGDWFDSLGNLLAIVFDLADKKKAEKILNYIKRNKIDMPYPLKAIYPPIKKGTKHWRDYYLDCNAREPNHYLNGGIWPFIGGFYILALIKIKRFKEAERELKKLAEANIHGNFFPEWINPINKRTHGIYQAWSAGMYILAYESLKGERVLV